MPINHGLVIGKFYPPHAGHRLLIQTAARQCRRVTVIVMAASHESIGLQDRVAWMQEIHQHDHGVHVIGAVDNVPVDYNNAEIWSQHVAIMQCALERSEAPVVDAVFSSEPYGDELARRFGAVSVILDLERLLVPISATRIREDVAGQWRFLESPVKAGLALQIVVVGAESTGTTTLSLDLVDVLRREGGADGWTQWVHEYGRTYSLEKAANAYAAAQLGGRPNPGFETLAWTSQEFVHIARRQNELQRSAARIGGPILVCDTDAFATGVWHERYLGTRCMEVEMEAERYRGALYLLTHHEGVTFEQDGVRDGEAIRSWMTDLFMERLEESGRKFHVLRGTRQQRVDQALRQVQTLRSSAWSFSKPLG